MAVQPPKIGAVPVTQDPSLAAFLNDLKKAVEHLTSATPPPQPVTNLKATAIAGGIVVSFTRSNATNFRLYASDTNNRGAASIIDLGNNNQHTDTLGKGGVQRYYWVEAISQTSQQPSTVAGPVNATSLALGTAATVTPPAQPSYGTVFDSTTGGRRPIIFGTDYITPGKQGE